MAKGGAANPTECVLTVDLTYREARDMIAMVRGTAHTCIAANPVAAVFGGVLPKEAVEACRRCRLMSAVVTLQARLRELKAVIQPPLAELLPLGMFTAEQIGDYEPEAIAQALRTLVEFGIVQPLQTGTERQYTFNVDDSAAIVKVFDSAQREIHIERTIANARARLGSGEEL